MSEKGYCDICGSGLAPPLEDEERTLCFRCEKDERQREEENAIAQEIEDELIAEGMYEVERNISKEEEHDYYTPGNYSILKVEYTEVRTLDDEDEEDYMDIDTLAPELPENIDEEE